MLVGAKAKLMVQVLLGATVTSVAGDRGAQVFVATVNWSVLPLVNAAPLMCRSVEPVFVTVNVCEAELVFVPWLPKSCPAAYVNAFPWLSTAAQNDAVAQETALRMLPLSMLSAELQVPLL